MIKMRTCIVTVVLCAFLIYIVIDCIFVYHETNRINKMIQYEIFKLKEKSLVAIYIDTPYINNPFESLLNLAETLFTMWFITCSYMLVQFATLLPFYLIF